MYLGVLANKLGLNPAERVELFSEKVTESGCWIWMGSMFYTYKMGYGVQYINGVRHRMHRLSYETFVGPIPDGYFVCHRCDVPACVNPAHLYAGTVADNNRDKNQRGRGVYLKGEDHGSSKLTATQILEIRRIWKEVSQDKVEIGREFGVTYQHIAHIVEGRCWRHLS